MPKRDDHLLISDILDSGAKILRYTEGYTYESFIEDERTVDAVIRNFEIIGEASRNVSSYFRLQHSSIPWPKLVGYRNLLIHEYFGINMKVVWNIIQEDLPTLLKEIDTIRQQK